MEIAKSLSIVLCDTPEIKRFSSTKDIQNLQKQIATELPDILLIDVHLGGLTDEGGLILTQHLLPVYSGMMRVVAMIFISCKAKRPAIADRLVLLIYLSYAAFAMLQTNKLRHEASPLRLFHFSAVAGADFIVLSHAYCP